MIKLVNINENSGIPLVGSIAFGVIDRGSNVIEVRPTTLCNLNCLFCSTGSGINPVSRDVNYEVEVNYLLRWVKEIVEFKGEGVEAHIDSVGEPAVYKDIVRLVKGIKTMPNIKSISMQSNGTLLDRSLVDKLKKAGLSRINLSIHSLNEDLSKKLSGVGCYDIKKVIKNIKYIAKSKINLLLAVVYLPGINDNDVEDLIKFAKDIKCNICLQKYSPYKHGRKLKIKNLNWYQFYNKVKTLSKKYDINLAGSDDMVFEKREYLPIVFKKNEKVYVDIKAPGWLKEQMLGVAKNRVIMIDNCHKKLNDRVRVEIFENKNNLYLAK